MVLLKDIAHEVGVSISLVSKILNDRMGTTGTSQETIRAVKNVAKRLGYRKNPAGVALQGGRQNVLGVYIHNIGAAGSGITESIISGISDATWRFGQRQSLAFFETGKEALSLCGLAAPVTMDGLLVAGMKHNEITGSLHEIIKSGVPVVTMHDQPAADDIPNSGMNQELVGEMAVDFLISRGAKRIAHIRNEDGRWKGYVNALEKAGIPYNPALVYKTDPKFDYTHVSGELAMAEFLNRGVKFDAVFAQSDQEAIGCIHILLSRGLRIPEDVQIIGVDNSPFCEFVRVPITSVSQKFRERSEHAVEMLMSIINGGKSASADFMPQIIERASTRPVG